MNVRPGPVVAINGIIADFGSETLTDSAGQPVILRPQAFAVLRHMVENVGRLVTKSELMLAVWPNTAVTDDSLVQCIHEIRRSLKDEGHTVLQTVSRRGYRLVLPTDRPLEPVVGPIRRLPLAASIAFASMVVAGTIGWWLWHVPPAPSAKPVVAVLPFDDFAADDASRRLADGLTEEIITDLARFPEFQVIARNTTEAYKNKPADPIDVGKKLGAGFVVEGSIQRQAGRVRITAQLIDAATGKHLWSDRWDRPDQDLFAIQSDISDQVSNRIGGGNGLVQEAGRKAAHRNIPGNLNAYELYLLGTEKLERINRSDVEEAIRLLTRAVELDPGLARAWVELYHSHSVMIGFGADPKTHQKLADGAAARAVALDPSDAEAHAVLGWSLGDRGDLVRAKAEFDTALRMAPNQFEILTFYAAWASTFGEPERGAAMADQAIRLNPDHAMWSARPFSYAYFMAGRYEDALRMIDRLAPENYGRWMWAHRPATLAGLGRIKEAKAAVAEALKWFPDLTVEGFVSGPGYNDDERRRLVETMRLAGFPLCAKPQDLAKNAIRLPECQSRP